MYGHCRPCLSLSLSVPSAHWSVRVRSRTLILRQRAPEEEEQFDWMVDGQPRQGRVTQRLQRIKEAVHHPVHEPASSGHTYTFGVSEWRSGWRIGVKLWRCIVGWLCLLHVSTIV